MTNVAVDEDVLKRAQESVGEIDAAAVVDRALRELTDRQAYRIHRPLDEEAYGKAVENIIALGRTDPNASAPPRRRFR